MEPWMKRQSERQQLLEDIQRSIIGAEEDYGVDGNNLQKMQEYYRHIIVITTDYLLKGEMCSYDPRVVGVMFCDLESSFQLTHFRLIRDFARSKEEEWLLVGELLEWAMAQFTRRYYHDCQILEITHPFTHSDE